MTRKAVGILIIAVILTVKVIGLSYSGKDESMGSKTNHRYTNQLIHETSPYLLQHAHNPVNWYPWGKEALNKAKEEDKPIFLSIGYSACHWCHVMEQESFENEEIARLMNEHFINIKVDREERPDLDEIYMSAVQSITGQGGWPMSVFLTPDLQPFYGGTYFPPVDRYGMPGFPTVLLSIARAYQSNRDEIVNSARELTSLLQQVATMTPSSSELTYDAIEKAFQEMDRRFDSIHGGFRGAPKFPHSMDLSLLLRYFYKNKSQRALDMVELSLEKMARGGMYDQLGGGFHRYSTDAKWLIPHFEKMLYDNALLSRTYTEAYQVTKKPFYKRIVTEILEYVLREMTSPEGGFYSTQDADSEGGEGAFFVWTPQEIAKIVGEKHASMVCRYFGVESDGNFEHGSSVLHLPLEDASAAKLFDMPLDDFRRMIQEAKAKLFQAREQRVKPGRDEKILTDWNGLMISSLAYAGNALNQPRYIQAAERACEFILNRLRNEGLLLHTYKDGRAHTTGFLSDYSFFINGMLDLYEAGQSPRWLKESLVLTNTMIEHYWDESNGAFFFTTGGNEQLIVRIKNPMDNAIPSGNSLAALVLIRLAHMTGNMDYSRRAEQIIQVFSDGFTKYPTSFSQMLIGLDWLLSPVREIVLAADTPEPLGEWQQALFHDFYPYKVVLYAFSSIRDELVRCAPVVEGKLPSNGTPMAYVCERFACGQPVSSIDDLLAQLKNP